VVVFLTGLSRGFLSPANQALLTQLIKRENISQASAWNSTFWHTGAVLGPALGGFSYYAFGSLGSYGLVVGMQAICLLSFLGIRKVENPIPKNQHIWLSIKEGLRFVFRNQLVLSALSLDMFAVLFGGAVAMLPAFAKDVLHVNAFHLGMLRAAPALGAVLVSPLLAWRPPNHQSGKWLLACVGGFGLATICFALSTNFFISGFLLLATGALDNVSVVIRHSILQLSTPNEMRGRVSAVNTLFVGSSNEIGAFESGLAARFMGLQPSVVFGGAMCVVVVLAARFTWPKLVKFSLKDIY
jgi:MFS family permease